MAKITLKQQDYIDNFEINASGYFYKSPDGISRKVIEECFRKITKEIRTKGGSSLVNIIRYKFDDFDSQASLLVFSYDNIPTFLSNLRITPIPQEKLIGYLLVIEIENYIVLLYRHVPSLKTLSTDLTPIQTSKLAGSVLSDDSRFIQLKMTNSSLVSDAIKNKSFEGKNLSNSLPRYNLGNSVVKTTKIQKSNQTISISFSTSHLSKLGCKVTINELCTWCRSIIDLIENPYDISKTMLNSFAHAVNWSDLKNQLVPKYLFIDFYELLNLMEREGRTLLYRNEDNSFVKIEIPKLLEKYSVPLELVSEQNDTNQFNVPKLANQLYVQQSDTALSLKSKGKIGRLYLSDVNERREGLISYINRKKCYLIGFDEINYTYTNAQLYHDASILENLDSMLDIFEPHDSFAGVVTEKGKINNEMTDFEESSMFYQVEKLYKDDKTITHVVCDDLGNEYADHIVIGNNKIIYVHSKCYSKLKSLSASALHVVIGQALKNIGNIRDGVINKKVESWRDKNYASSSISLCRKGELDSFESTYRSVLKSPNGIQEVCLAVNFISKRELKNALDQIRVQQPVQQKGSVIQLIWLLSGFILACKEASINCKILCRP